MPRVVPSAIIAAIDRMFDFPAKEAGGQNVSRALDGRRSGQVAAVIQLAERIPDELLQLGPEDYAGYVAALETLKSAVRTWTAQGLGAYVPDHVPGFGKLHALTLLRQLLHKCPDEFPPASVAEMRFIRDRKLREMLRRDFGAAGRAVVNAEWKAATVLAGSVMEALLLWKLEAKRSLSLTTARSLHAAGVVKTKQLPGSDLENWKLEILIKVAEAMKVITADTASLCQQVRGFRNLIHPSKAQRKQDCHRGTAFAAIAGVECVVSELS